MSPLPRELPADVTALVDAGELQRAVNEIATRYKVSGIDALRAIHNVMGGVAADAELHKLPPEALFTVNRTEPDGVEQRYRMEVRRAPEGSKFQDEYKLIRVDPVTGKRWNSVHFTWEDAVEQARMQFGIQPSEWNRAAPA